MIHTTENDFETASCVVKNEITRSDERKIHIGYNYLFDYDFVISGLGLSMGQLALEIGHY